MSAVLIAMVCGAGLVAILGPLLGRQAGDPWFDLDSVELSALEHWREEKANMLLVFRELDFDYETGKLSKQDYKELRQKYEARAVEVFKRLEEVEQAWQVYDQEAKERFS